MSIASKPTASKPTARKRQSSGKSGAHLSVAPSSPAKGRGAGVASPRSNVVPLHAKSGSTVRQLPVRRSLPQWLQLLVKLQQISWVVAVVLLAAALVVYGITVYSQQTWSKEYRRLKSLERDERQMMTVTGSIKQDLAEQAERPASGLLPRNPSGMIFLPPAPQRPAKTPNTKTPQPEPSPQVPLGY